MFSSRIARKPPMLTRQSFLPDMVQPSKNDICSRTISATVLSA
jgi:hypothetical protein